MPIRFEDLPPNLREQVQTKYPDEVRTSSRRGRKEQVGGGRWRCHACGHETIHWAKAEKHADQAGHVRIECLLSMGVEPNTPG